MAETAIVPVKHTKVGQAAVIAAKNGQKGIAYVHAKRGTEPNWLGRAQKMQAKGESGSSIADALRVHKSSVYYWLAKKKNNSMGTGRGTAAADLKRAKEIEHIVYLRDKENLGFREIGDRIGIQKDTAAWRYNNFKKKQAKGELNGNNAADSTNRKGWTLEAIAGACTAEVTRVITGFSDTYHNAGTGITPEKIQRRVLELLASETVRS